MCSSDLTIVPLYVIAFGYGQLLVGDDGQPHHLTPDAWNPSGIWHWMLDLGKPLGVGLVALALTLALVGYIATAYAWRLQVVRAWEKRARAREDDLRAARTSAPREPRDPGRG